MSHECMSDDGAPQGECYHCLAEEVAWERSRCRTIRPGTLGYQHCRREVGHKGAHRSQDDGEWRASETHDSGVDRA